MGCASGRADDRRRPRSGAAEDPNDAGRRCAELESCARRYPPVGTGSITNGAMSALASLPASIVRSAVSTSLPAGSLSKFAMMTAPRPDAPHVHMVGGFVVSTVPSRSASTRIRKSVVPTLGPGAVSSMSSSVSIRASSPFTPSEARDPHGVTHEVAKEQVSVVAGGSAAPSWCGPSTVNAVIAGHLLTSSDSFVEHMRLTHPRRRASETPRRSAPARPRRRHSTAAL